MKFINPVLSFTVLFTTLFLTQTHLVSCQKQVIPDTLIIKDTIRIRDTIRIPADCNCSMNTLKEGLVAYYNFNGGNLNDSSGFNNHIILNNAVTAPDRFGNANNAYMFNGTSSYMEIKNSSSLNLDSITIVARIKVSGFYTGLCNVTQVVSKGFNDQNSGTYGLRILEINNPDCSKAINTSKLSAYGYRRDGFGQGLFSCDTTNYVSTGVWKTYVFTYNGKQADFYTDGVLTYTAMKHIPFNPTNNNLLIGRMEDPQYPYWFNGVIDEVRIYNRALCGEEVKLFQDVKN